MTSISPSKDANRVVVLISGRGSNLRALLEAGDRIEGTFVGVISSRASAGGLEIAREHGLPTEVVLPKAYPNRAAFDARVHEVLTSWRAEWVALAGFMRILTHDFVAQWNGRMINIHPSLLPAFPGLHPQKQALEAGVTISGCTAHFVSPGDVDSGAIIAQSAVPVLPDDTEKALSGRILKQEHRLYPAALAALLRGSVRLEDGRVVRRADAPVGLTP